MLSQISIILTGGTVAPGETVEVDVIVSDFENIASIQFSINWDPNLLTYGSIENITSDLEQFSETGNIGTPPSAIAVSEGQVTVTWSLDDSTPRSLADSTRLFTIRLNTIGNVCGQSDIIVSSNPRRIEIADSTFTDIGAVASNSIISVDGTNCDESTSISCRERDSLALIALYNATDGLNWSNTWDLNRPIDEWHGIEINNNKCVTSVKLFNNRLNGLLPTEFGSLSALKELNLSVNKIKELPNNFGQLENLEFVSIEFSNLSGDIPNSLSNLEKLTFLGLGNNKLTGLLPDLVNSSENLKTLRLHHNELEGPIPMSYGELINLNQLYLDGNNLSGCFPSELTNLCYLVFEDIVACQEEDAPINEGCEYQLNDNPLLPWQGDFERFCNGEEQIGALCAINGQEATISENCGCVIQQVVDNNTCRERDSLALVSIYKSTDGPNWINTWDTLRPIDEWFGINVDTEGCVIQIDLDGNPDFNNRTSTSQSVGNNLVGTIPDEIGELTNCLTINIAGNNLSGGIPNSISKLDNLVSLSLINNGLGGEIPSDLFLLKNLTFLQLIAENLTGSITNAIFDLEKIESLNLGENNLSGSIPEEIGQLLTLKNLILIKNNLSGEIPKSIGNLKNIESSLWLSDNQLSGEIPHEIGNLIKIEQSIWLQNNNLTGNIPSAIGNLKLLRNFYCDNNKLTGNLPEALISLDSLRCWSLSNNSFSGCIPDSYNAWCENLQPGRCAPPSFDGFYVTLNNNPKLPWGGEFVQYCNSNEQIGAPCDDGNPVTSNDIINQDCQCMGTLCNTTTSEIVEEICEGDSINILGNWISNSIEGEQIMSVDSSGCSIINTVTVTITEFVNTTLDTFICSGELISINGFDYNELGIYEQLLSGQNGCDSLLTILIATPEVGLPCDDNNPNTVNDVFVTDCSCQGIVQTNVFTPDGNGDNDLLKFTDSDVIEDSELWIYNRWGDQIYKKENYTNDWDGGGYPDGVYYYVLKVGETVIKNSLTILR